MKFDKRKSRWNSLRARAALMFRLFQCTDGEVERCASALLNANLSECCNDQNSITLSATDVMSEIAINETPAAATVQNSYSDQVVEVGREISRRICNSLQDAREKTEDAVLAVCDHVTSLVEIARQGNAEAQNTLHAIAGIGRGNYAVKETSIAEVVHTQAESVNHFVADTREFFNQQIAVGEAASKSCQEMQACVSQVVKLVFSSEILAYNIQIESARLGDDGRAFSVLGDEMVRFSSKVRDANIAIQTSLKLLVETMGRFQEQSKAMDYRLDTFTEQLRQKMTDVQQRTANLTKSLHLALDRITHRNQEVIACSQHALSELQFQDPLAQSLMRTESQVEILRSLIESGTCDSIEFVELYINSDRDDTCECEPGVVALF